MDYTLEAYQNLCHSLQIQSVKGNTGLLGTIWKKK